MKMKHIKFIIIALVLVLIVNIKTGLIQWSLFNPVVILAVLVLIAYKVINSGSFNFRSNSKDFPKRSEAIEKIQNFLIQSQDYYPYDFDHNNFKIHYNTKRVYINGSEEFLVGILGPKNKPDDIIQRYQRTIWNWTHDYLLMHTNQLPEGKKRMDPFYDLNRVMYVEGYKKRPEEDRTGNMNVVFNPPYDQEVGDER